jgi:hypothetical protein
VIPLEYFFYTKKDFIVNLLEMSLINLINNFSNQKLQCLIYRGATYNIYFDNVNNNKYFL